MISNHTEAKNERVVNNNNCYINSVPGPGSLIVFDTYLVFVYILGTFP